MSANRKPWTEQDYEQATDAADELGMELHALAQLTKLAAFAAESRRVLVAIEDQLAYRPEVRKKLMDNIEAMCEWSGMCDTSSDALAFIARKMDRAAGDYAELVYRLANRLRQNEQAAGRAS